MGIALTNKTFKIIYFIYLFIVWIGGATYLTESDTLLLITTAISFILFFFSGQKFKINILILLFVFFIINVLSILFNGYEFDINAYIGYNLRILIAYFSIAYFGWDFFVYYRKAIYIMAIISLPFYIIQLINIDFFINNFPNLNMSGEERKEVDYWNFFIYTAHQGEFQGIARNCSFAIEPGHFAFLLGLSILLEFIQNDFHLNKVIIQEILVGITTFSTTYFIVFILFLTIGFLQNKNWKRYWIISLPFFMILLFFIIRLGIINEKIEKTAQLNEKQSQYGLEYQKKGAVLNRIGMFEVGMENFITYPFGHGLNSAKLKKVTRGEVLTGPNTLAWLIIIWGVLFIVYFPWAMFKFLNNFKNLKLVSKVIIMLIFIIWLFSFSIQSRDFIFFMIMIIPLINLQIIPHPKQVN